MLKEYKTLADSLRENIRDIPDFPKPGIIFKDITPILSNPEMTEVVLDLFDYEIRLNHRIKLDAIAGTESRGFLFGILLANRFRFLLTISPKILPVLD